MLRLRLPQGGDCAAAGPAAARRAVLCAAPRSRRADELLRCLRDYVLLSAIEVDGQFAAVGALLRWRFPNAAVPFACAERRNVSPSAQKSRVRDEPQRRETDALALNQLDTLLWRHVTATHPLAVE